MMPGHEDREDRGRRRERVRPASAAMMPGHEDREDVPANGTPVVRGEPQ